MIWKLLRYKLPYILASLLLCANSYATDNPLLKGYPENKIMGFRGLDTRSPAPNIADGRAVDLLNVKLSTAFDLKKRYGYSTIEGTLDDLNISSPAVTGIFDSEFSNGTSWTLAFVGNELKYDNVTLGRWVTASGSSTITSNQDYQWNCVMANDKAVCTNAQDNPIQVNSTPSYSNLTLSGLSNQVTKTVALVWFRNYLIFGGTTENSTIFPSRFRWSDVGSIAAGTDNNFVDIASNAGDEIVAFQELYGDLYIFMRKSIWKASLVGGDDVFVFAKIIDGIGTVAKNSVKLVNLPGDRLGVIFLSEDKKVYLFNGVVVSDIGVPIQPNLDTLNASRLQYATAIFDTKDYFLSISSGGASSNDVIYDFQTEIGEWSKLDNIDANCFARVKESTSLIKTYFGNYSSFVYWMDNPDNYNDVDGATGIIDSVGTTNTSTMTQAQVIIDSGLVQGIYTGALMRITSGTAAGQERTIMTMLNAYTGLVVSSAFSTTPDSTSNYSIGDINSFYYTKWYDMGDAPRYKGWRQTYFWAKENSANEVTVSYAEDFGSVVGSETKSLSPASSSLWDSAIWDSSTWGTTGDKFYNIKLAGKSRYLQLRFSQTDVDKYFNLYGYHLLADWLDRE